MTTYDCFSVALIYSIIFIDVGSFTQTMLVTEMEGK